MKFTSLVSTAALTAALATGCVIQKDAPSELSDAIPTSDQVAIKLPQSADRMLGEVAPYYVATRGVTATFNGGTAWVLVLIHSIVLTPPTSVAGNVYTWGPGSQALDPANYRLDVTANADGTYSYVLSGESKINPDGFKALIDGHAVPGTDPAKGTGEFRLDFDAAKAVDPVDNGDAKGQVDVTYDLATMHLSLDIASTDANGDPIAATYEYDQGSDGGGDMTFDTDANVGGTAALEEVTLRSRWLATGAGRADARITAGDLGADQAIASECWDTMFERVYYTDNVNFEPTEGDPTSCAFADQDLPPAE
jgi:hypothetical protein